ncbi:hypothetical protein ABZ135_33495 [Streptomyces sp. NPDC006339]|uniref:hypothetical protein n=1 Tax=Streptomyces sp. NPDC006339 TaxID=3156755 RepID=UPI0033BAD612
MGNTHYATPAAGAPLRLRISFTRALYADTYGGLRLAVVHAGRGDIDAVELSFVDHGTFHRRDEARNTLVDSNQYGTFNTYRRAGKPPWEGAETTGLRDAIEQYTAVWFPGAWATPAPRRITGLTAHKAPAQLATRSGGRGR